MQRIQALEEELRKEGHLGEETPATLPKVVERRALVRLKTLLENTNDCPDVVLQAGEVLFEEGGPPDFVYLVLSGELEIEIDEDQALVASPGDLLGETAVMTGRPRNATVRARDKGGARLAKISPNRFKMILSSGQSLDTIVRDLKKNSFERSSSQIDK